MSTSEIQSSVNAMNSWGTDGMISKMKWFLSKMKWSEWGEKKDKFATKAFVMTRKTSVISLLFALIALAVAAFLWWIAMKNYADMNAKKDSLKLLDTYGANPDVSLLNQYVHGNGVTMIDDMLSINLNVKEELLLWQDTKENTKNYYEMLLQKLYLPSLNIWKNQYTDHFDMSLLWQRYLDVDKFQDSYLMEYWGDFIKDVGNDAEYNVIDDIQVWDITILPDSEYFYIPISVNFTSPNKRSFLLLVNKLSMTSNPVNIGLINEFFYYLVSNIKEQTDKIEFLEKAYWTDFSSSSNWEWSNSLPEYLSDSDLKEEYDNKVIWYYLYQWVNNELTWWTYTSDDWIETWNLYEWTYGSDSMERVWLIDDSIVVKTIKENAMCDDDMSNSECFYNFRDKYRDIPYLAYGIWLINQNDANIPLNQQTTRTEWLLKFLQDIPSVISISDFGFQKYSDSTFLNWSEEKYQWTLQFNAYGKNVLESDLDEASDKLGKLCFGNNANMQITPDTALKTVQSTLSAIWSAEWNESVNASSLTELEMLVQDIQARYGWMSNYDKMVKLFELWRMLNDANLCNS